MICTYARHQARSVGWECPDCGHVVEQPLYERALENFGFEGQIIALAEEAGELAAACCRLINRKGGMGAVVEEAVGVESVLASIRDLLASPTQWEDTRKSQSEKLRRKLDQMDANRANSAASALEEVQK